MKTRNKILIAIMAVLLCGCFLWNVFGPILPNQTMIHAYVKLHDDELETIAQNAGYAQQQEGTITIQRCAQRSDMVEFTCWGKGLVPSSTYIGFYYSSNDVPIPFQGVQHNLYQQGKGWAWQQPKSDNHGYTEKITNCWYYFEASF